MIRIIVLAIGLFVIWMLFFSDFPRKRKIDFTLLALFLVVGGLWLEGRGSTPRMGLIEVEEVVSCGATGERSYLTNFNVDHCLQNNSTSASVKRLGLKFSALACADGECTELESVEKDLQIEIAPQETINNTENIAFNKVPKDAENLSWEVEVVSVKATR
ncbi:MAG: hypothetical protein AAF431_02870 [Pseudomonadota bacterium]